MEKKKNQERVKLTNSNKMKLNIFWGIWMFLILVLMMGVSIVSMILNSQVSLYADCGGNVLGNLTFNGKTVEVKEEKKWLIYYPFNGMHMDRANNSEINVPDFENFNLNKMEGRCKFGISGNVFQIAILNEIMKE